MQKKTLILSIIVVLILIISILFYYFYFLAKPKYLTNIAELYSSFTDYMRDTVDYRLQLLGCEPKEYYYDNSNLCFVCDDTQPCFSYGWVTRGIEEGRGIKKKNPKGIPYLAGVEELEVKMADFCQDGLASEFNCKKIDTSSLECEKIRFVGISKDGAFRCNEIKLMLKEGIELKSFVDDFCGLKKEEVGETIEFSASCGQYIIGLGENREIMIVER